MTAAPFAGDGSPPLSALHHVGVTVARLDRAVDFWSRFLGAEARDRARLDAPPVGQLVGYPGIRIERCWLDLPGGVALELLEYLERDEAPYDPGTAHPGNVHLCLGVVDLDAALAHALTCGAALVSEAPIRVRQGPSTGARVAYLRCPDGVTIELFQRPAATG